jgi:hypothetical protein
MVKMQMAKTAATAAMAARTIPVAANVTVVAAAANQLRKSK